jgi:hypothetical protein
MKITSFDKNNNRIKRDSLQGNLFNLFEKNLEYKQGIPLYSYIIPREFEMRMDRISNYLYGSENYVEELMILNDIISPYSIKEGQEIYFCRSEYLEYLSTVDKLTNYGDIKKQEIINSSRNNRNTNILNDENLPLTIKPSNLEQISVSKDNTVRIINSFE